MPQEPTNPLTEARITGIAYSDTAVTLTIRNVHNDAEEVIIRLPLEQGRMLYHHLARLVPTKEPIDDALPCDD